MKTLAIPAAVLLLALALPSLAQEPDDLSAEISRLAKPLIDGKVVSGMTIGIIRGEEVRRFAYGDLPAGVDSVFEIGSITKVFTGYLLADMVRDGAVKLEQPVRGLLPEGTKVPKSGDREIKLLDLATHRSGLPRMPSNFAPKNPRNPYADYDEKLLFEYLARAELKTVPGAKKLYSNLGMGFLGHALAKQAGLTYEELLASRISGPLKLPDTAITLTDSVKKRLAPGHDADLNPELNWDLDALAGAGAIRSTVADMLAFLAAHFEPKDGVPDFRLAWQPGALKGSYWHNGQTGGYHGMAIVVPSQKLAVVVLADTATRRVDELGGLILRSLLGEKVKPPRVRIPVEVDAKVLEKYVGSYRYSEAVVMEISRDERGLLARMPNQPTRRLYGESAARFFLRVIDVTVEFEQDEDGAVTRALLHQNGKTHPAPRVR